MSFVLVPSPYEQIPDGLRATVPEFAQSEEYRLVAEMCGLPGVILAAFAKFIGKLAVTSPGSAGLKAGLGFAVGLCSLDDHRINAAVNDEFFPTLYDYPGAIAAILPMMEPPLREAFSKWAANER